MPTQTTLSRVESFPFDSRADGYDADGYPVYDRAVGAAMLRATFAKFFTDGVFPSPGTALQISKGSGLTVTIDPGIFIIRGAMGGYLTDAHSITLDTAAPQGNTAYGIMLRYDENEQYRSCYIRVVRGDAAGTPQPPAPDQSTPGVMEYRLGYVTVPSGATDLDSAIVTNEKGLAVCPYAAPFEKIDMSAVTSDAISQANYALTQLLAYFREYEDLVDSAVDGTTAGNLQNQITAIQQQLSETALDLSEEVDDFSIEYTSDNIVDPKKLRVKDGGITQDSLSQWLQIDLGIADTDNWTYDDFKSMAQSSQGDEDKQESLMEYLNSTIVTSWTDDQIVEFAGLLTDSCQVTFVGYLTSARVKQMDVSKLALLNGEVSSQAQTALKSKVNLFGYQWSDMHKVHQTFGDSWASTYVGQTKAATVNGESYTFRLIGVGHDMATDGSGSTLTFQATESLNISGYMSLNSASYATTSNGYGSSSLQNVVSNVYDLMGDEVKTYIRQVSKNSAYVVNSGTINNMGIDSGSYKLWVIGGGELYGSSYPAGGSWNAPAIEGGQYQYWSQNAIGLYDEVFSRHGTSTNYSVYTRTGLFGGLAVREPPQYGSGSQYGYFSNMPADIVPCFCI